MKKLIALSLAAVMALSLVACGGNNETTTTQTPSSSTSAPETTAPSTSAPETTAPSTTAPVVENPASALEVLQKTWAAVAEDDKFYVVGGDYDNMVDGDAGVVLDTTFMADTLRLPETLVESVDNAAGLIHGMLLNYMAIGAYQVKDGTDLEAFATACKEGLAGAHWICGAPEVQVVIAVGNVVVFGYGLADNFTLIQNALTSVYADAQILVNDYIEG